MELNIILRRSVMKKSILIVAMTIEFLTNDSLPLVCPKLIYFPTLTVVIRCVFKQNEVFYPQVYFDDALHQL